MRFVFSLFFLLFALVATVLLIKVIVPNVSAWGASRDWVQHDATLIHYALPTGKQNNGRVDLYVSSKEDLSSIVQYSYSIEGKSYQGNRLAISGVEPSAAYFYKFKKIFDAASNGNNKIKIWVNPGDASDSVVDRSFRWRGFDMAIIFFIGFGVIGYSVLFEIIRATFFFIRPRLYPGLRGKAERQELSRTVLFDRDTFVAPVGWGIIMLICLPIAGGFRFPILNLIDGNIVLGIVPLLIGLAAVGIIAYAVRKSMAGSIKVGAVNIAIDEYPILVGRRLSGFAKLKTRQLPSSANVYIKVGCDQRDYRKTKVKNKKLWGDSVNAQLTRSEKDTHANFDFEIPDDLPSASKDKSIKFNWWLELNIEAAGTKGVSKRYDDLGVFNTGRNVDAARAKRFKDNIVTTPKLWDYSTVFITNGSLFAGILFFSWSLDSAILVILIEAMLISLLTPIPSLALAGDKADANSTSKVIVKNNNKNYKKKTVLTALWFLGNSLFVVPLFMMQLWILNAFYNTKALELLIGADTLFAGLVEMINVYGLWVPIVAVIISMPFEWRKLSLKSKQTDNEALVNNMKITSMYRMFFTTFILLFTTIVFGFLNQISGTQGLLFVLIAFKIWIEYSLIRWGKLAI